MPHSHNWSEWSEIEYHRTEFTSTWIKFCEIPGCGAGQSVEIDSRSKRGVREMTGL